MQSTPKELVVLATGVENSLVVTVFFDPEAVIIVHCTREAYIRGEWGGSGPGKGHCWQMAYNGISYPTFGCRQTDL